MVSDRLEWTKERQGVQTRWSIRSEESVQGNLQSRKMGIRKNEGKGIKLVGRWSRREEKTRDQKSIWMDQGQCRGRYKNVYESNFLTNQEQFKWFQKSTFCLSMTPIKDEEFYIILCSLHLRQCKSYNIVLTCLFLTLSFVLTIGTSSTSQEFVHNLLKSFAIYPWYLNL